MDNLEKFESAYNEYSDAIFRYLFVQLKDREKALELTQEVFSKTWQYMEKGKEIDMMRPFLYKVAHNLFVNEIRYKKQSFSLEEMQEAQGFEPKAEVERSFELSDEFVRLLDKLHPAYKEVIILRYIEEFKISEIAEALGETENSISVKLHRAINSLRTVYEK